VQQLAAGLRFDDDDEWRKEKKRYTQYPRSTTKISQTDVWLFERAQSKLNLTLVKGELLR
jgi:hypothetical protein